AGPGAVESCCAPQVLRQAALAPRPRQLALQPRTLAPGREVELNQRMPVACDELAQVGGDRVDQAAFDPVLRNHALALQCMHAPTGIAPMRNDRLQRGTRMAPCEVRGPADVEAAVGR